MALDIMQAFEDRAIRIPREQELRDALRKPQKIVTASGVRIAAETDEAGHADEFWAIALMQRRMKSPAGVLTDTGGVRLGGQRNKSKFTPRRRRQTSRNEGNVRVMGTKANETTSRARSRQIFCRDGGCETKQKKEGRRRRSAQPDMALVVRPAARDRWSSATLANLTPDRVLHIMRGVVSGSFTAQWELFDLMEDTWPRLKKNLNELKRARSKVDLLADRVHRHRQKTERARGKEKGIAPPPCVDPAAHRGGRKSAGRHAVYDLCDGIGKGISVQEILWDVRDTPNGPMVLPRAFQWI